MAMKSWLPIPAGSHFSLANLPVGIITHAKGTSPRPAVAIGEHALDLEIFTAENGFKSLSVIQPHQSVFGEKTLNAFAALGRPLHSIVRKYIQSVFLAESPYPDVLKNNAALQQKCLVSQRKVRMHLPMHIGDYTDFYVGLNHAFNCGVLFRGPDEDLQPNYKHLPVGYHGRASSIVVSGTPIRRPRGQVLSNPAAATPQLSPCTNLDFELELAAFVCKPNVMGESVDVNGASDHLFGLVLMNDWSARDIQRWEMVPLGPFNSKNFGTSVSPWVVLMDALEPFKSSGIKNDVENLSYLREKEEKNAHNIKLEVELSAEPGTESIICRTDATNLLFSFPQMLAHHTVGGCPFSVGDMIASGTISGTESGSYGCMLEQNQGGRRTIELRNGGQRKFLEDGDTLTIRGCCGDDPEAMVGFGECSGTLLPATV